MKESRATVDEKDQAEFITMLQEEETRCANEINDMINIGDVECPIKLMGRFNGLMEAEDGDFEDDFENVAMKVGKIAKQKQTQNKINQEISKAKNEINREAKAV